MKKELKEYKQYLISLNLKRSSIKNYIWHLNKFFAWLDNEKITEKKLKEYYEYLLHQYDKIATINLRLIILNNYLKYLKKRFRYITLTHKKEELEILSSKQLQDFLEQPLKNNSAIGLRDKVLLELLYSTGLKVGKIILLKKEYIDDIKNEIIINNNIIPIQPIAWSYLEKYLEKRKDDSPWLFINFDRAKKYQGKKEDNNYLTVRSVERIIEKYSRKLKPILKINPQILRNTLAYNLKKEGVKEKDLKQALHFKSKIGAEHYYKRI